MSDTIQNGQAENNSYSSYAIEVQEDEAGGEVCFIASHPELPGCMAQGRTRREALESLAEARELYLHSLINDGLPIPLPQSQSVVA